MAESAKFYDVECVLCIWHYYTNEMPKPRTVSRDLSIAIFMFMDLAQMVIWIMAGDWPIISTLPILFLQGLHITNIKGTNKCVVAAVELSNATYENFEEILQSTRGRNVTMTKKEGNFHINQEIIEDTSFISSRAHEHCTEGYHWMVQLPVGASRLPGRPGDIGRPL